MNLHPEEALALVLADIPPVAQEAVPLHQALDRYLHGELHALVDQPPFDKSAMDGYAYASPQTVGASLCLHGESVAAGAGTPAALPEGSCVRIMTGAPLPPGTLGVQRREYAREEGDRVRFIQKESSDNIIRRGENQRRGDTLLTVRRLQPQDLGILASSGYAEVPVAVKPTVGVVSTGDELAACGEALAPGCIYDSNGPQLCAQAAALGCETRFYGIVRDDRKGLRTQFSRALVECDVLIISGAVSLGDFDYVPETLTALGVRKIFHGLKMRPGKPAFYGRLGDRAVFGLPGNPVSTFVNFEVLVKPHLLKRLGVESRPGEFALPLAEAVSRRDGDRVEYLPGKIVAASWSDGRGLGSVVLPLPYMGSSMLAVLSQAECLFRMDLGVETIPRGGIVYARPIRT